ncbi:MAG TPA: hypothetical protein VHE35_36715, partial [Kofleriaceae bacterium]|nr:hypothetical protein [Kofleriaceae bacterium]
MMEVLPWLLMAVAGGAAVGVLAWRRARRAQAGASSAASQRRIDALVAAGDVAGAARVAREAGRLDVAFQLLVQAKDLLGAAAVAVERNDLRRAANLYEQLGEWRKAVELYDQVGLHRHADTLRATKLAAGAATRTSRELQAAMPVAAVARVAVAREAVAREAVVREEPAAVVEARAAEGGAPETEYLDAQPRSQPALAPVPSGAIGANVAAVADVADVAAPGPGPAGRELAGARLAEGDI